MREGEVGYDREASLGCREPVEKLAWAISEAGRDQAASLKSVRSAAL